MKLLLAATAIMLTTGATALAFDAETQSIIARHKTNKPVAIGDVAQLMRSSQKWCYAEQDATCAWTDIYLEVTEGGVAYEIGNAWDAETDIAFTDHGTFSDNRYICETGYDWVPSIRATRRSDGSVLEGRALWDLKNAVQATRADDTSDCFDYVFLSANGGQGTVTLLQRQFTGGEYQAEADVEVTLHMNAEDAAGLSWRW